jgi:hypothetical protein
MGLYRAAVVTLGAAGIVVASAGEARAGLVDCPAAFILDGTAKVHDGGGAPILTAADDCEYIVPADNNNVANAANVNAAGFFGFTDWAGNGGNVQVDASAASGTWAIAGVNFALYDYMITFKDGQDTNLISFLLNESYSSGGWSTPFTEPPFTFNGNSASHNVSHYSIFQRLGEPEGDPDPVDVPEPAALLLLGGGFAVAATRMRRRTA